MMTWLVLIMAESWRVTISAACLWLSLVNLVRTLCLAVALSVSAVLLRTRTVGLPRTASVTVMCRPLLLESPRLCLLIGAL